MAGISQLVCAGFIETKTYERSHADLKQSLGLSDREIDDRIEAVVWALHRDPAAIATKVGNRNLWVAATPGIDPILRIYLRPRLDVPDECELLWIEERF